MNPSSYLTKQWTLLRYAAEISHQSPFSNTNLLSSNEKESIRRETIDCTEGILTLKIATTQQLYVLRDGTEYIESVDLLSIVSSSIIATYIGDSLLISYSIPYEHIRRKFLIRFASTADRTGLQHCNDCVKYLSRFINVKLLNSTNQQATTLSDNRAKSILSMNDMIEILMNPDSMKLPTYYNQEIAPDTRTMSELIEKYLSDETFPDFVANVAAILETLKDNKN